MINKNSSTSKFVGINDQNLKPPPNLFRSAEEGDLEAVKRLTFFCSDPLFIDQTSTTGKTALILAATAGNYDVVQYLCNKGANVHIKDAGAWKAEKYASYYGQKHIAINIKRYWFNGLKLLT